MQLIAKLSVRNKVMRDARKRLGLSQRDLAEKAGTYLDIIVRLERLDYRAHRPEMLESVAMKIAIVLSVPMEHILPLDAVGKNLCLDRAGEADVPVEGLIEGSSEVFPQLTTGVSDEKPVDDDELRAEILQIYVNKIHNSRALNRTKAEIRGILQIVPTKPGSTEFRCDLGLDTVGPALNLHGCIPSGAREILRRKFSNFAVQNPGSAISAWIAGSCSKY